MALKNTYIKLPAINYINDAQVALIKAGAAGIQTAFEEGRIIGIAFTLPIKGQLVQFKLPVNWRNFQRVLKGERNPRAKDDDYAYRVAWACTKDWIEAQMAFVESENVTIPQVFLPFAVTNDGDTLFEKIDKSPNLLLGTAQ